MQTAVLRENFCTFPVYSSIILLVLLFFANLQDIYFKIIDYKMCY